MNEEQAEVIEAKVNVSTVIKMAISQEIAHYLKKAKDKNAQTVTSSVILKKTAEHAPTVDSSDIKQENARKKINALTAANTAT